MGFEAIVPLQYVNKIIHGNLGFSRSIFNVSGWRFKFLLSSEHFSLQGGERKWMKLKEMNQTDQEKGRGLGRGAAVKRIGSIPDVFESDR